MSITKRITTTLFSRIDSLVGELENHDALIKAAIDEQKKKLAAAKMQLSRIKSGEQEGKSRVAQLKHNEKQWAERAVREVATDEGKAMLCMQKRKDVQEEIVRLQGVISEYGQMAQKMTVEIDHCDRALKDMIQKHELMCARQSTIDAVQVINDAGSSHLNQLQESFDRWQVKLIQGEIGAQLTEEFDSLEQAYIDQENADDLKRELQSLVDSYKGE